MWENPWPYVRGRTDAGSGRPRKTAPMEIDRADLLDVARMQDPGGVVSVYVDVDMSEAASPTPAWAESIAVKLDGLDMPERLVQLRPVIAETIDPTRHGIGRALFFGATGGEPHAFTIQMPLETSVTVAEAPRLLPLLAAVEAGRPAGIVAATLAEVRNLELAYGEVREIDRYIVRPPPAEWSERKEPNRLHEEDRRRIARHLVPRVERMIDEHGWDRVVLVGNSGLTHPLAKELRVGPDVVVHVEDRDVRSEEHPAEIANRVRHCLDSAHRARTGAALEHAYDAAAAGGRGATGLDAVLRAATDGRAEWVALDRDVTPGPIPAATAHEGTALLSHTDAAACVIKRALETDARIAVVPGALYPRLAEVSAVALLRW